MDRPFGASLHLVETMIAATATKVRKAFCIQAHHTADLLVGEREEATTQRLASRQSKAPSNASEPTRGTAEPGIATLSISKGVLPFNVVPRQILFSWNPKQFKLDVRPQCVNLLPKRQDSSAVVEFRPYLAERPRQIVS